MTELSSTWQRYLNPSTDARSLQAFYRNECGKGLLETPQGMPAHELPSYLHGSTRGSFRSAIKEYLFDAWFKQRYFAAQYEAFKAAGVKFPPWEPVYGPFFANIQGHCFNANLAKDAANYLYLTRGLPGVALRSVCEIGAGYGGFCELMMLNCLTLEIYYIIDLPETLAVAAEYLNQRLCRMVIVNELDDLFDGGQVFLIPADFFEANKAELAKCLKVDLFFNSNSFVEMSRSDLASYTAFIDQFDCYLFSSNAKLRFEKDSRGQFINHGIEPRGKCLFYEQPTWNHDVKIWRSK